MNNSEQEEGQGFSTLDMMALPAPMRRVTRIMMRKREVTREELDQAIQDMLPEEKRPTPEELEEALVNLVDINWLEKVETDEGITFRVRMGRKTGSDISRSGPQRDRQHSTMEALWDTVDSSDRSGRSSKSQPSPKSAPNVKAQEATESGEAKTQEEDEPTGITGLFARLFRRRKS
ncbi:MAG: hypothetical protein GYB68_12055 [Chloroflexi bacterium]|nr:hypothetical protein [Chloroflexota bacterium]